MLEYFVDPQNDLLVSLRLQLAINCIPAYAKSVPYVKRDSSLSCFPVLRYS